MYHQIAESWVLWLITFIAILLVLYQTFTFLKHSFKAGSHLGIEKKSMKRAFTTGMISAVGPSTVVVIGMVSLLVVTGGPTALMRLTYIGNVAYELLAVEFAAASYDVMASDPNLPVEVLSVALWCMAVGCVGWIIVTALFTDKMEKLKSHIASGKNSKLIPALSTAAMLGAYGYLTAGYAVSLDSNTISLLVGFAVMLIVTILYKKKHIQWLNEWGLTIAMIAGVLIASFF